MASPGKDWTRVPVHSIDQTFYGRTVDVYLHAKSGVLLIHHKPASRFSKAYRDSGTWWMSRNRELIARRSYYGAEINKPPFRWANQLVAKIKEKEETCDKPS